MNAQGARGIFAGGRNIGRRRVTPVLDRFAELLSLEVSPADAAERMGFDRSYGKDLMKCLRKRLGGQAI